MLGDGAQGFPFAFVQLAHRLFDGGSGDAHVFLRYWVPWTSTSPSRSPGPAHDRQDHTTVVMGLEVSPIPGSQTGWTQSRRVSLRSLVPRRGSYCETYRTQESWHVPSWKEPAPPRTKHEKLDR